MKAFDGVTLPFGRYEGKTIAWIVENDRNYTQWVLNNIEDEAITNAFSEELERQRLKGK